MNQLEELDAYAKRVLATIPETQRVLVTAHDAFRYLGRAYGIEVKGNSGAEHLSPRPVCATWKSSLILLWSVIFQQSLWKARLPIKMCAHWLKGRRRAVIQW